jgi:DNA-binding HxlR family transcriptional regulator
MGVLGKKWTLLILRDIGFRRIDRFNDLMRSNPGLGPRILSRRLKELESKGFIRCLESTGSPMVVRWGLTKKGKDALPILAQFLIFGARWYADEVFIDKKPREPDELFIPGALALIRSERR